MQIGLAGLTFLVLLILQLTGAIAISWWWVFTPLLIGAALVLLVLFVGAAAVYFGAR